MLNVESWVAMRAPLSNEALAVLSDISLAIEHYEQGDMTVAECRVATQIESDYARLYMDANVRTHAIQFFQAVAHKQVPHTALVAKAFFILMHNDSPSLSGFELADIFEFASKPLTGGAPLFHVCFTVRLA